MATATAAAEPAPFSAPAGDGVHLDFYPHAGQLRALESPKRFILVLAGSQSGKSVTGPLWMWEEIGRCGAGDYLCVAPSYPLMQKKMLPEFLRLFQATMRAGDYKSAERTFVFRGGATRVFFGHADDPESLEAATAKAAWLDEAGQKRFRFGSWEAILRRLAIHRGRCLLTTTPYDCYDAETEIYTRSGWKSFADVTVTDEVLACTPTGQAHFERPQHIIWRRYIGPMISMTGGRVNLLVTPGHKMAYRNSTRFYAATAASFVAKKYRSLVIPKTVRFADSAEDTFELPPISIGHRWGPIHRPAVSIPMADWCAFLGWFLSEGCVRGCKGGKIIRGGYRVDISQTAGAKRDLMRDDLRRLPFRWSEGPGGFSTSDKQLWSYLRQFGHSGTKFIPPEVKRASAKCLAILIDRMVRGDGSYRQHAHGEFQYYTTSPRLAEDFREICMLSGVSTKSRCLQNAVHGFSRPLQSVPRPIYHIAERRRHGAIVQNHETVQYDGYVGCVTVSTGFVLVRRRGEEVICGNCGWVKQQLFDPWVKAGREHTEIDVINFDSTMNPAFPREEFERARAAMPAWRFAMFFRGQFEKPAGLIYDCFDDAGNTCPRFAVPPHWRRYLGLDFGGVHTAGVFFAEDPGASPPRYYAYREYLAGGRTAKEHAVELLKGEPGVPVCVGGSKSEGQWRSEFCAGGLPVQPPAITDVEVGIDRCYGGFKTGQVIVFNDLPRLLDEIGTYSRPTDDQGNPLSGIEDKESFHELDGCRYILGWLIRGGTAGVYMPRTGRNLVEVYGGGLP
jgi:hypothetical protein